jgi:hypothetical protein
MPILDRCSFESCVWHLSLVLSDRGDAESFREFLRVMVIPSIAITTEGGNGSAPV